MDFSSIAKRLGIGETPLLPYEEDFDADIFVKYETYNATGSVKDRPALNMILCAERDGILTPGCTIVEATSGNMGISLAYVGASRGYKVLLTMPDTMSAERRTLLQGLGAQLVLTEGKLGMQGAVDMARQLALQPNHVWLDQFNNPANTSAHIQTGQELVEQLDKIDVFVAGVGTGATISGVAQVLLQAHPDCQIVAVEPASSATLSRGEKGAHVIQGIGAGFVPPLYNGKVVSHVQLVTDDQALQKFAELNHKLGYCCGISSAANIVVCERLAKNPEYKGKNIVTLFADSDDRYESMLKSMR
ncbi:MAG: cysteine synthase family protein [Clostridia bacterium]|nr:cysteine synthase family protein [Clostridia bacterium]MBQ3067015.1 cysteine synthase family protein [Clostridia bacterium]